MSTLPEDTQQRRHRHGFGTDAEDAVAARLSGARADGFETRIAAVPRRRPAPPAGAAEREAWARLHSALAAGG